jgi:hypothetical protein
MTAYTAKVLGVERTGPAFAPASILSVKLVAKDGEEFFIPTSAWPGGENAAETQIGQWFLLQDRSDRGQSFVIKPVGGG